jgi:NADH-quinone oxidoreductase subunit C
MAEGKEMLGAAYVREKFADQVVEDQEFNGQVWLTVKPEAVHDVVAGLKDEAGFDMLEDLTAVDYLDRPEVEGRFRIVYHFLATSRAELFRLKAFVEDDTVEVATVSDLYPGANWLEREVYDMFGLSFANHPDLRRMLLPDDWEGYPCRRDYDVRGPIPITDPMREGDFERKIAGDPA